MSQSDQDIDTAGTEADEEFRRRHDAEHVSGDDPTAGPAGVTPETTEEPRGSEPATLHRAEDDDVAFERSPEFHDPPGSGRHRGKQERPDGKQ